MAGRKITTFISRILCLGGLLAFVSSVAAEHLPIKTYTTADGLVSNQISRIVRDSRGYLWFCTQDGLSRFDGYTFTNYTTQQGLPSNWVDALLETRSGIFLVGTKAGLCVFDPNGEPLPHDLLANQPNVKRMFVNSRPAADELSATIKVLYEDSLGNIWCGTKRGLFRVEIADGQAAYNEVSLGITASESLYHGARTIVEEKGGVLWILTDGALFRRFVDGGTERFGLGGNPSQRLLMDMVRDPDGTLWVSSRTGLWKITPGESGDGEFAARKYSSSEGLSCIEMTRIYRDYSGRLWAGTDYGLFDFLKKEERFRLRLGVKDIKDARIWTFCEDRVGNLWIGTANGAIRIAREGFTTFTESDGLGFRDVYHITETATGEINLYTRFGDRNFFLDKFTGERFISRKVAPRAFRVQSFDLYQRQTPIRDHLGEWWWPTKEGLFRYSSAERIEDIIDARPIAHYTIKDGLPADFLGAIYEDRGGNIWIFVMANLDGRVVRWERATGKFHVYSSANGLPANASAISICEDGSGNLWIGYLEGGIARYREGRFTIFGSVEGVPQGEIRQLLLDIQGRVWIASNSGGLGKMEDVSSERPRITTYTTANGLASNSILYIAQDRANQFYVATNRGLNHINFDTGGVKLFSTNDGLANDQVDTILRDSRGAFWFGTVTGVSRLLPAEEESAETAPPIFINSLKIAGQSRRISEIGETDFRSPELAAGQNQIELGFGSLAFGAGDSILYRYKLEGADGDWRPWTAQRTVNFANLAPGSYRFLVQAVNAGGVTSEMPASFSFTILAPIWQRWWFIATFAVLAGLIAYALYRYRVARFLEIERVRTRIASDLHDDIGANLTKIAILSEVAQQQLAREGIGNGPFSSVARISRESLDSMGDIVWAINPRRDSLHELVRRMRGFATDIFTIRNIDFGFHAPVNNLEVKLGPDLRRDVFLIFKEAVNNAVRHSGCSQTEIELKVVGASLELRVSDDGTGFDEARSGEGNGLVSMRRRAEGIHAQLVISSNGEGTSVILRAPIGHRGRILSRN